MANISLPLRSPTKSLANSIKGQKKLTNKANPIRVRKLCVLLFIKTSGMSIRAFLYSRRAEEARHNDLLLFSSLIMTQTKTRCPSARPLIKPNTLYHLLITSTQQQESWTGQHLLNARREQSSGRTGSSGKHPVY